MVTISVEKFGGKNNVCALHAKGIHLTFSLFVKTFCDDKSLNAILQYSEFSLDQIRNYVDL